MSTTLPPGTRPGGFSTIFWKIHGWAERRAIFKRIWGKISEVGIWNDLAPRQKAQRILTYLGAFAAWRAIFCPGFCLGVSTLAFAAIIRRKYPNFDVGPIVYRYTNRQTLHRRNFMRRVVCGAALALSGLALLA